MWATRRFHPDRVAMAVTLTTLAGLGGARSASAQGGYEECKQILVQDIFNRVRSDSSSAQVSSAMRAEAFFSESDSEAYNEYSKAHDEAEKKGTSINAEFHYGFIGGEFGLAINSEKKLSESEFSKFRKSAKEKRGGSSKSEQSSNQSLVTSYASEIRDPGTIQAWRDCISRTREMGVYAFASRDNAGAFRVNVMWVPGPFAASAPSIPVSFVADASKGGIKVIARSVETIAVGSGRSFAVQCGKACDQGFTVAINATLMGPGGKALSSFTNAVEVPPVVARPMDLQDILAAKGAEIAAQDPISVELRRLQPAGACRRGFEIGMAAAEGQTAPGPGKEKLGRSLSAAEQLGYNTAVSFSLLRNRNRDTASRGAAVARQDPRVAEARSANPSPFYRLGFDIATGIFADAASGALGHTAEGPGSQAIRDEQGVDGQAGFRAAVSLFLVQKYKPAPAKH